MSKEAIKINSELCAEINSVGTQNANVYPLFNNSLVITFDENTEKIKWGDEKERILAIKNIKNYLIDKNNSQKAIDVLSMVLESDSSGDVRLEAVFGLWATGDRNSFPILRRTMINDSNPKVRARAIRTLGFLGDTESLSDFIYFFKLGRREHALVRSAVINAFGSIFHSKAIEYIIEATNDADINIRRDAARALGTYIANKSTEEMAINKLEKICNWNLERDVSTRCFAIHSLRYTSAKKANELASNSALKDPDASVRGEAISSLYVWPTELSIKTICKSLSDINWQNRKKAIFTLKRLLSTVPGNNIPEVSDALLRSIKLFPSNSREHGFTKSLINKR